MTDGDPNHAFKAPAAFLCGGVPTANNTLLWRTGVAVGDPVAHIERPGETTLIVRDIEVQRAKRIARADVVACPADFTPEGGLSGDRETATAQAAAECLRRAGLSDVTADRSLPFLYVEMLRQAGITVRCDPQLWVEERRQKTEQEIEHLQESQRVTELAMAHACGLVGTATAAADGTLSREGQPLTSERVRVAIDRFLLDHGYTNPQSIVAGGPTGADCHDIGSGPLRTGQPVIVDIFPRSRASRYWGDCTRTVVHGDIPDVVRDMHATVREAKAAGTATIRAGVTGQQVHEATLAVITAAGYGTTLPTEDDPPSYCGMTHGSGHGIGLDVHEPPLLDFKGPELLPGDALTIEPGLYRRDTGGIRVEDMVIVTPTGCRNLNILPESLTWDAAAV